SLTVNDGELDSEPFEFTIKHKTEQGEDIHGSWLSDKIYVGGDIVSFEGKQYKATWWTKGTKPGTDDVWENMNRADKEEWNVDKIYQGGEKTQYQGKTCIAKWWTKGDLPGKGLVWELVK
ncbi:carbohydrate-binding protein, partial [Enterobacter chuandaensis]